jgi:hypothetical protein
MVSTKDFESFNLGSNPSKTFTPFYISNGDYLLYIKVINKHIYNNHICL